MLEFVATYQLSGPPPQGWQEQLEKFAADSGLKASPSTIGNQAIILCRVPESSVEKAGAIAKAFFDEAAATVPGMRLVKSQLVRKHKFRVVTFARALLAALVILVGLSVFAVPTILGEYLLGRSFAIAIASVSFVACLVAVAYVIYEVVVGGGPDPEGDKQQAAADKLAHEIAKDEDPKLRNRIEAARISLRMRAGRMRRDADHLWQRSIWTYRSALLFFALAIAGPIVAATLVLKAATVDWHLMFGGLGLAAVPLTIGTALLRHDTKLRDQYKEAARDVATLERYELALDYARIGAQPGYDATLQQVITQLLTSPAAPPDAAPAAPSGKEDVESQAAITAVATKLVEAVTSSLGPKK